MKSFKEIMTETLDLTKEKRKEDFLKIIKVIHSIKTKDQAETTRKMIENFFGLHMSNKLKVNSENWNEVYNTVTKRQELMGKLQQVMKQKYKITLTNKELGL